MMPFQSIYRDRCSSNSLVGWSTAVIQGVIFAGFGPIGFRNSSNRISPGVTGLSFFVIDLPQW